MLISDFFAPTRAIEKTHRIVRDPYGLYHHHHHYYNIKPNTLCQISRCVYNHKLNWDSVLLRQKFGLGGCDHSLSPSVTALWDGGQPAGQWKWHNYSAFDFTRLVIRAFLTRLVISIFQTKDYYGLNVGAAAWRRRCGLRHEHGLQILSPGADYVPRYGRGSVWKQSHLAELPKCMLGPDHNDHLDHVHI